MRGDRVEFTVDDKDQQSRLVDRCLVNLVADDGKMDVLSINECLDREREREREREKRNSFVSFVAFVAFVSCEEIFFFFLCFYFNQDK